MSSEQCITNPARKAHPQETSAANAIVDFRARIGSHSESPWLVVTSRTTSFFGAQAQREGRAATSNGLPSLELHRSRKRAILFLCAMFMRIYPAAFSSLAQDIGCTEPNRYSLLTATYLSPALERIACTAFSASSLSCFEIAGSAAMASSF